jgi:5'-3' exonuclease
MVEFEADDALATAAARFASGAERIVILSPDKDLAQCVHGHVVMHDRIRGATYDAAAVEARFGVPPAAIPDLLALVGDRADGIPGLPGWGKKSAAAVLAAHGRLEDIPDDPAAWRIALRGRERLAAILASHRAEAALYKLLATLRTDVPLAQSLDDLHWRGTPRAAFQALCAQLGFADLLDRPARWSSEA